jgi:hypothetical protein
MTKAEMRKIAIGAARSYMKDMGFAYDEMTCESALRALDDLARIQPGLISAQWYSVASINQIKVFRQEWSLWLKQL